MNIIFRSAKCLHDLLLKPRSINEYKAQREYIFNVMALIFMGLNLLASALAFYRYFVVNDYTKNISIFFMLLPLLILILIYVSSRIKFSSKSAYIFISMYVLLATLGLNFYGLSMSHGLLIYALAIVMVGIIISSKAAFGITLMITMMITGLALSQSVSIAHPYVDGFAPIFNMSDVIVYNLMFCAIFLASALSNNRLKSLLIKAKNSEIELMKHKEVAEKSMKQKIFEIEEAYVKDAQEMYRFAEFGKISSSIIHDLADPVTALSLNFGQIEGVHMSDSAVSVRENLNFLEQYIQSARRQLSGSEEIRIFDSKTKIKKVINIMKSKACSASVHLELNLEENAKIMGDVSRFSQVISNLVGNAIDSYANLPEGKYRKVIILSSVSSDQRDLTISIQDKGIGIDEESMLKIFDPFYTTKPKDRGSGIGLTIARRIIYDDFQGAIDVRSNKDQGTIFNVILPVMNK